MVVLVTGGSRGIGEAAARAFAARGDSVAVCCSGSMDRAEGVAREIGGIAVKCDVSVQSEVHAMFETVKKSLGQPDVLVNNAGIDCCGMLSDTTEEQWDRVMDVNVKGMFLCIKEALPHMVRAKRGRIVNVSSMWGISGASCEAVYSASKAAVIGLTKSLAAELAPSGITVNAVAPGCTDTDMMGGFSEQDKKLIRGDIPLGRFASPEEIAAAIVFLSDSGFITGHTVNISGGQVI